MDRKTLVDLMNLRAEIDALLLKGDEEGETPLPLSECLKKKLDTNQASELLGISKTALLNRIKGGFLSAFRVGRKIYIHEEEIVRCLNVNYFCLTSAERSLRIRAGCALARARGTRIGRPITQVDGAEILQLRLAGTPWRKIAKILKVGVGTACRALGEYQSQKMQKPTDHPTRRDGKCREIPLKKTLELAERLEQTLR